MNKMQMAHEMALAIQGTKLIHDMELVSDMAWKYAEAMQAKADEREDKTRPKALLTKDKDGKCLHFNHEFGHKKCMDCGASLEGWQPDWSQAPDGYNYWVATADHSGKISGGWFYDVKPEIGKSDGVSIYYSSNSNAVSTGSFGYIGNWQDSLRKRPESIKSIDPKEYIDAVLQDIVDPCDHEWTHISKFGAEGDFYVCPCGAKSKRPQRRTK